MKIKLDGKFCGVCGDKALGCNFNAITCESCKAFFRRNALLQKDFKCPFSEHCEITPITRRFCQKCRLDKCFSIGMCKTLIMSEEDKEMKRKKILENRCRKRMGMYAFKKSFKKSKKEMFFSVSRESNLSSDQVEDVSFSPTDVTIIPPIDHNDNVDHVVNKEFSSVSTSDTQVVSSTDDVSMIRSMLNNTPHNCENVDLSTSHECFDAAIQLRNEVDTSTTISSSGDELLDETGNNKDISVELNPLEYVLCEAIKLEFQTFSPLSQTTFKELNDAERAKLNELIVANKVLSAPLDEELKNSFLGEMKDPQQKLEGNPALLDVINLTAIAIRRLIKMTKRINAFRNMCQEDQVALLKGGSTEIMILRGVMDYDCKKQAWQIPKREKDINLNVDVLKLAKNNVYEEHKKFFENFDPRWRADENIILIMCAIILFTPERPRVVHKDVIKLEQNSYYYLLRRYLECTYVGCEAKSTLLKLMQKISELHSLNEELVNVYLDVNPSQVEPLLIEIFDLKH